MAGEATLLRELHWTKRAVDVLGSLIALILLTPILALVTLLIWLDSPGPILFRQFRVGYGGTPFRIFKFRTMVEDAEQLLPSLESCNTAPQGVLFNMVRDPRVTRVGRVLRRLCLDELPQLLNVLRGDMSLVGPRPLTFRDCENMSSLDPAAFARRCAALPGITGLTQVSGNRDLPPGRVLELDNDYVQNRSLGRDLLIMLNTLTVVVTGRGVY
jgi:lipopolysaccharide/colanic/teichoic acid biosynthesis glycosyltransferase